MNSFRSAIVIAALVGLVVGDGAPYSFNYEANDEGQHQRNEQGEHGQVQGSYSYVDPNGHLRQVNYVADEYGFHPSGDIGVDKETEAAAADLAAQAPQPNMNINAPGASGSYGKSNSNYGQSNYGQSGYGQSQKGYNRPAPRPAPRQSYQSKPSSYAQQRPAQKQWSAPAQKQWKPSSNSYSQQQNDDYSGPSQESYSYKTQITHSQPSAPRSYNKPSQSNSYSSPRARAPKPQYKSFPVQQQQQNDWQEDSGNSGQYEQSNDWSEPRGRKQSVAYEVRSPTHKIVAKYN